MLGKRVGKVHGLGFVYGIVVEEPANNTEVVWVIPDHHPWLCITWRKDEVKAA